MSHTVVAPSVSGRLIYVMGPSGAGKDALIDAARPALVERGVAVVQRVITRSSEARGEHAVGVTETVFESMIDAGAFALHWQANGLSYGIPRVIDEWLGQGQDVLVNGSRAYLAQARQRYPRLLAIRLNVDLQVLRARLVERGRETAAQIELRLTRGQQLEAAAEEGVHVLDNSGPLERTVEQLMRLLTEPSKGGTAVTSL